MKGGTLTKKETLFVQEFIAKMAAVELREWGVKEEDQLEFQNIIFDQLTFSKKEREVTTLLYEKYKKQEEKKQK